MSLQKMWGHTFFKINYILSGRIYVKKSSIFFNPLFTYNI